MAQDVQKTAQTRHSLTDHSGKCRTECPHMEHDDAHQIQPDVQNCLLYTSSPVAWFFACFFLIPADCVVRKRLQKEMDIEKEHDARTANA